MMAKRRLSGRYHEHPLETGGHNGPQLKRKASMSSSVPGNESKPLGQSQKPHGWNRGSSGKFESATRTPSKPNTCQDVIKTTRSMPPSKKRKMTTFPPQPVVVPPAKQVMSDQEKHNLGIKLESLLGEMPLRIIDFLTENGSNGEECGKDELEIDIDDLKDDTLFALRKILDDFLLEKQMNETKVEVGEIQVLNDSGPSNSSSPPFKGKDSDHEEVDIGGNETPVSSYPPMEIEKDTTCRINTCLSLGSSDMDSSDSSDSESDDVKSNPANIAKEPENMGSGAQMVENSRQLILLKEINLSVALINLKITPSKSQVLSALIAIKMENMVQLRERCLLINIIELPY